MGNGGAWQSRPSPGTREADPAFSHKTGRWSFVAGGRQWSVPAAALQEALTLMNRVGRLTRPSPTKILLHEVHVRVWEVWARSISHRVPPRGRNATEGRDVFVGIVRMAAAWAYLFSLDEMKKPAKTRSAAIRRFENTLKTDIEYMSA